VEILPARNGLRQQNRHHSIASFENDTFVRDDEAQI
jgi:hypothetical protein